MIRIYRETWGGREGRGIRLDIDLIVTVKLSTSLTNHPVVPYFKYKERIYKSTHFNLGFIGMICKVIIGITYGR